jgi:hypothetical protein
MGYSHMSCPEGLLITFSMMLIRIIIIIIPFFKYLSVNLFNETEIIGPYRSFSAPLNLNYIVIF